MQSENRKYKYRGILHAHSEFQIQTNRQGEEQGREQGNLRAGEGREQGEEQGNLRAGRRAGREKI